jgi:hypothetical protein
MRARQERYLFSWRLVLIDLTMMLYLLVIFATCMAYGLNVTTDAVMNAAFTYVHND